MSKSISKPAAIPMDSLIFGYLPMLPFVLGALGCWFAPALREVAVHLTVIWSCLILAFVGGVRRGFGFGRSEASLASELWTMALYVSIAGLALILGWAGLIVPSLALLAIGFALVSVLDHRAAKAGNAPAHFAGLRPIQMPIASLALLLVMTRLLMD
ncbi:DUF3429 family protein [Novosphingobium rosa]|uniref:DUF3429 family protein n=1 Tax=Novosphingobium rosa TaxID=76978 RepID=UPI00082E8E12|nr:DUF3429 family protein [Novosphingobium rosa]